MKTYYAIIKGQLASQTWFSDVSMIGWCGTSLGEDSTGEHWNKIKAKLYINKLETIAAYFACMAYGKKLE